MSPNKPTGLKFTEKSIEQIDALEAGTGATRTDVILNAVAILLDAHDAGILPPAQQSRRGVAVRYPPALLERMRAGVAEYGYSGLASLVEAAIDTVYQEDNQWAIAELERMLRGE